MKKQFTKIALAASLALAIAFTFGCEEKTSGKAESNPKPAAEATAELAKAKENFLKHLKSGKELHPFFSDKWTFVYHKDGRCAGSTDGEKSKLSNTEIDKVIKIKVANNGGGWYSEDVDVCGEGAKKAPSEFYMDFRLKESVKNWDRFEIPEYEEQEKNIVYVKGSGESEYLKLYYDSNNLIIKMEYRNEDPG